MRKSLCFFGFIFLIWGRGILRSDLKSDRTLSKEESPYYVEKPIVVEEDATLWIEPGVEVWMCSGCYIVCHGSLKAMGSELEPILFTGVVKKRGYWNFIQLDGDKEHVLEDVIFEYGGGSQEFWMYPNTECIMNIVEVGDAPQSITLTRTTFSESGFNGLRTEIDTVCIGCRFMDNSGNGILGTSKSSLILRECVFLRNGFINKEEEEENFVNYEENSAFYGCKFLSCASLEVENCEFRGNAAALDVDSEECGSEHRNKNYVASEISIVGSKFVWNHGPVLRGKPSRNVLLRFLDNQVEDNPRFHDHNYGFRDYEHPHNIATLMEFYPNSIIRNNKIFRNKIMNRRCLIELKDRIYNVFEENNVTFIGNDVFGNDGRGIAIRVESKNAIINDNSFVNPMYAYEVVVHKSSDLRRNWWGYASEKSVMKRIFLDTSTKMYRESIIVEPFLSTFAIQNDCSYCYRPRKYCNDDREGKMMICNRHRFRDIYVSSDDYDSYFSESTEGTVWAFIGICIAVGVCYLGWFACSILITTVCSLILCSLQHLTVGNERKKKKPVKRKRRTTKKPKRRRRTEDKNVVGDVSEEVQYQNEENLKQDYLEEEHFVEHVEQDIIMSIEKE